MLCHILTTHEWKVNDLSYHPILTRFSICSSIWHLSFLVKQHFFVLLFAPMVTQHHSYISVVSCNNYLTSFRFFQTFGHNCRGVNHSKNYRTPLPKSQKKKSKSQRKVKNSKKKVKKLFEWADRWIKIYGRWAFFWKMGGKFWAFEGGGRFCLEKVKLKDWKSKKKVKKVKKYRKPFN